MPELTVDTLEQYSKGRLSANDDESQRIVDSAMAMARRYCGWHVAPVRTEDLVIDGSGHRLLSLPTMALVKITAAAENGTTLDPSGLACSTTGLVVKRNGQCWTHRFGGVAMTIQHGFETAPDWDSAILDLCDRLSRRVGGQLVRERVDDISTEWATGPVFDESAFAPFKWWPQA